jgi:hypothetical protein
MSSFTTPLVTDQLVTMGGTPLWQLRETFSYYTEVPERLRNKLMQQAIVWKGMIEIGEARMWIHVPPRFVTDFASVPRMLWWLFPPYHEHYGKAAVIHDFLYVIGLGDRKWADKEFLAAMKVLKAPAWKRYTMYWAVRLFGKSGYGSMRHL